MFTHILGGRILLEKLQQYRPKIAVFNGKGIYEVFSGKKEFTFGKQPECIDGTNTVSLLAEPWTKLPFPLSDYHFYNKEKKVLTPAV